MPTPFSGGLVLPAACRVQALYEPSLILVARHDDGGRTVPKVGTSVVCVGPGAARHRYNDDRSAFLQVYRLDFRERRRLNSSKLRGDIFQRRCGHLLANDFTAVRDTEKNKAAESIEHGANRLGGFCSLPCGAFELEAVRFSVGHEIFEFASVHRLRFIISSLLLAEVGHMEGHPDFSLQ